MEKQNLNSGSKSLKNSDLLAVANPVKLKFEKSPQFRVLTTLLLEAQEKKLPNSSGPVVKLPSKKEQDQEIEEDFNDGVKIPHFTVVNKATICAVEGCVVAQLLTRQMNGLCDEFKSLFKFDNQRFGGKVVESSDYNPLTTNIKDRTFGNCSKELIMIDCRFGYEFQGGHIRNAVNINDSDVIEYLFFENGYLFQRLDFLHYFQAFKGSIINMPEAKALIKNYEKIENGVQNDRSVHDMKQFVSSKSENHILISTDEKENCFGILNVPIFQGKRANSHTGIENKSFCIESQNLMKKSLCGSVDINIVLYCEFSSKRAPSMYTAFRSFDRKANVESYPQLHFPNLYLLNKGYDGFVKEYSKHCDGEGSKYVQMLFPDNISPDGNKTRSLCYNLKKYNSLRRRKVVSSKVKIVLFRS